MALTRRQIDQLLKAVSLTRSDEPTCDQCLRDLAEFAERYLANKAVSEGLRAIEHHLAVCPECREEYQTLLAALKDTENL